MRLARLELKDIGPFEDAVFEIPEPTKGTGELVLFEGPNGCGKTTIVQAIACAVAHAKDFAPPLPDLQRRFCSSHGVAVAQLVDGSGTGHVRISELGVTWLDGTPSVRAQIDDTRENAAQAVHPLKWAAFANRAHQASADLSTPGPRDIVVAPLTGALSFGEHIPESKFLGQHLVNVEFERVQATLYAQEERPSGERETLIQGAARLRASLKRFERALTDVLGRRVEIRFQVGKREPDIKLDGVSIPMDVLGEGMRSTIAWLSDLLVRLERITWADTSRSPPEQDFWLILDEIDESLHPTMQAHIYPALRKLFPNARIYATTHSPFVVASVGEGTVFPIRPDKDRRVRGKIEARALEPGLSLEWVTSEIFQAQTGFIDAKVQGLLADHKRAVRRFERTGAVDWEEFFKRRAELMTLNDEVRVVVAMQETPMRAEIDRRMLARAESREQGAST